MLARSDPNTLKELVERARQAELEVSQAPRPQALLQIQGQYGRCRFLVYLVCDLELPSCRPYIAVI